MIKARKNEHRKNLTFDSEGVKGRNRGLFYWKKIRFINIKTSYIILK